MNHANDHLVPIGPDNRRKRRPRGKRLKPKNGKDEGLSRTQLYELCCGSTEDRSLLVFTELLALRPDDQVTRDLRRAAASRDWETLVRIPMPDPSQYENAEAFGIDYCISELLSKMAPSNTGANPEDLARVALDKFKLAEDQCAATNQRIYQEFKRLGTAECDPVVKLVRRNISKILGAFSWDEASAHFGHGGGATTRLKRRHGDAYYKFRGDPDTTKQCETLSKIAISLVKPWQGVEPSNWSDARVRIVRGNRITTVPKTAKIDRVIAKEPCMNIYVQRGIGQMIRQRLKRAGVRLNDQTANQKLSQVGSETGELATVDLSMASDTISRVVAELFLPTDWFDAMNLCRSHFGVRTGGDVIRYQKFSTSGNGFTFELESLIFWALCSAVIELRGCADTRLGVYGDDLIIASSAFETLVEQLERFGFTPNPRKSFHVGPFRESCGKHWFKGRDVTPFYIRKGVENIVDSLLCTNNVRRWLTRLYDGFIPPTAWSMYTRIRDALVPEGVQRYYRIPDGYGDLGLVSSFEEALPQKHPDGWTGWQCLSLAHKPIPDDKRKAARVTGPSLMAKGLALLGENPSSLAYFSRCEPGLLWKMLGVLPEGKGGCSDEIPIESGKLRLKNSKLHVARWEDVGIPY